MEASNSLSNELGSGGFGKVFLANNLREVKVLRQQSRC